MEYEPQLSDLDSREVLGNDFVHKLKELSGQVEASHFVAMAEAMKRGLLSETKDRETFTRSISADALFGSFSRSGLLYEFYANAYQINLYVDVPQLGRTIPLYSNIVPGPNGDPLPLDGALMEGAVTDLRLRIMELENLLREAENNNKMPEIEEIYDRVEPRARARTSDEVRQERERWLALYRPRPAPASSTRGGENEKKIWISETTFSNFLSNVFAGVTDNPQTTILDRGTTIFRFEGHIPFTWDNRRFVMEFMSTDPERSETANKRYSNLSVTIREEGQRSPFTLRGLNFNGEHPDATSLIEKLKADLTNYLRRNP